MTLRPIQFQLGSFVLSMSALHVAQTFGCSTYSYGYSHVVASHGSEAGTVRMNELLHTLPLASGVTIRVASSAPNESVGAPRPSLPHIVPPTQPGAPPSPLLVWKFLPPPLSE